MKNFTIYIISFLLLGLTVLQAQDQGGYETEDSREEYKKEYEQRIKLTHINDVYIPTDLQESFEVLNELSNPAGMERFRYAREEQIAQKLKGGLQRWILINWGFLKGSRLSHHIKSLGIHHPEDMAQFIVVSWHRHLNDRPLHIEEQVAAYQKMRKEEYESRVTRDTIPMD